MRRIGLVLAALAAACVVASPATAGFGSPACGDVVTADLTLTASLTGCAGDALVVGADGITIDLNGYSITGTGDGRGVVVSNRFGITVRNGFIRGFGRGVAILDSSATITELSFEDAPVSINRGDDSLASSSIVGNRLVRSGIGCSGENESGPAQYIADNVVTGAGIALVFCPADLVRNSVTDSPDHGIARFRSRGLVESNRANNNGGDGIWSSDSHALFLNNVTNANAGDGLEIKDAIASHGPLHTVEGHRAMANGGYGIAINPLLEGVVDAGDNRAHANGESVECLGLSCK